MLEAISTLPPYAEKRPVAASWHGRTVVDDFAWLKAENWQEVLRDPARLDPAIRAYLEAENAYADRMLAATQPLQHELFAEMKARIKADDWTVPRRDGAFAYFLRFRDGG